MRRPLRRPLSALLLLGAWILVAGPSPVPGASAQESVSVEDRVIAEVFEVLDMNDVPAAVRDRLGHLVPWAAAQEAWPPLPPTPTASGWPKAVQRWRDVAPEWRQAAEGFAEQRRRCRDQVRGTTISATMPDCARLLAAQLRVRHAERLVAGLGGRLEQAGALPEPAQTRVTEALTQVRERAMERLRDLESHDDPALDGTPDLDRDRIRARLRDLEAAP